MSANEGQISPLSAHVLEFGAEPAVPHINEAANEVRERDYYGDDDAIQRSSHVPGPRHKPWGNRALRSVRQPKILWI